MHRKVPRLVGGIDPWLVVALLGLVCIGVLMVYSSSIAESYAYYGSSYYMLEREVLWMGVGLLALFAATRVDYHRWQQLSMPMIAVSVVMLALVLVPHIGHTSHGAQRWFSIGAGITVQPSEIAKLALVVYMAAWLNTKGDRITDFKAAFVPFSLMVGLVALLVIREPDLGTAIVITLTMFALFFVAGASLTHMATVAMGSGAIAWMLIQSSSYRYDRLTAFTNPWKDPTGVGYHTVQALLALGSGGVFGQGLGNSWQKYILPAPHTDSILAVIGEEWGLVGTLGVLLLFVVVAYRGMRITAAAPDGFGRLVAAGITSWITFQALMNFAVITSSVPFTGVPLPFISYGGSSLIITMIGIGILLNISKYARGDGFASRDTDHGRRQRRTSVSRIVGRPQDQKARRAPGAVISHPRRSPERST